LLINFRFGLTFSLPFPQRCWRSPSIPARVHLSSQLLWTLPKFFTFYALDLYVVSVGPRSFRCCLRPFFLDLLFLPSLPRLSRSTFLAFSNVFLMTPSCTRKFFYRPPRISWAPSFGFCSLSRNFLEIFHPFFFFLWFSQSFPRLRLSKSDSVVAITRSPLGMAVLFFIQFSPPFPFFRRVGGSLL